jgi:hypothetical protein
MAIDRAGARRRVRTITAWAAGGALALTTAFAFGAARGNHAAARTPSRAAPGSEDANPQAAPPQAVDPQTPSSDRGGSGSGQGFTPPAASNGPPAGMSGGS